jgi:hypothetical protein
VPTQPLILDRYVLLGLNAAAGLDWPLWGWSTNHYERYLDFAHRWAQEWGQGTSPDVVERTLFERGKFVARSAP